MRVLSYLELGKRLQEMLRIPDPVYPIETADATNLAEAITLVNAIKDYLNNDVFLKMNLLLETLRNNK